jgi:AraC family transcriptional regulator of adaptative response/methylated-DNA-[protein]-cysteine methyltransferase
MEVARLRRDPAYDGVFFVGVRSTGVFCRPSCAARAPRPENVTYYPTAEDAIDAGLRPCKRCRPLEAPAQRPVWLKPLIERIAADPSARVSEEDMRALGVEPTRARRWFKEHYGMTFHAYARARRLTKALGEIRGGAGLDDAAYENGFESLSGFREAFRRAFGTPPGRASLSDPVAIAWVESPVGPLITGANGEGVCLVEFSETGGLEEQLRGLARRLHRPLVPGDNPHLERLHRELASYFDGSLREFTVPLVYRGSEFEVAVWDALRRIPYGQTLSYAELAEAIGRPGAQRAVGRANGLNRIAIVIPCHRVVNKSGALGGYTGGVWRKQVLLDLERSTAQARLPGM